MLLFIPVWEDLPARLVPTDDYDIYEMCADPKFGWYFYVGY